MVEQLSRMEEEFFDRRKENMPEKDRFRSSSSFLFLETSLHLVYVSATYFAAGAGLDVKDHSVGKRKYQ
eukprot:scaffold3618_cov129-Cylindrotheca_fusiformis.AAC.19